MNANQICFKNFVFFIGLISNKHDEHGRLAAIGYVFAVFKYRMFFSSYAKGKGERSVFGVDGSFSFVEMLGTVVDGAFSFVEMLGTVVDGSFSFVEMLGTVVDGTFSFVEMLGTVVDGSFLFVEMLGTGVDGLFSFVEMMGAGVGKSFTFAKRLLNKGRALKSLCKTYLILTINKGFRYF